MRLRLAARAAAACALALPLAGLPPAAAADPLPFRVPPGYRVVWGQRIAAGVEHYRLQSDQPPHVVEIGVQRRGARFHTEVRHAPANGRGIDRSTRGTSALCGRCAYATNGDYAFRQAADRTVGRPVGGVVERGVVLVSPNPAHQQASYTYDGGFTTERLAWSARLTRGDRVLRIAGKNVPRGAGQLVLYTPDWVRSTGTNAYGAELTLELPGGARNLTPNVPVLATISAFRYGHGDAPVRPGTLVLSGHAHNAEALRRLWLNEGRGASVELAEELAPGNVWASVGGGHILIRDGRRWFRPNPAPFLTAAHPRTFVGVTAGGHLFQATVDGRERNEGRSAGMPLEEATRFFTALGAREVMNMDGGGSTTFVRDGRVVNRPSDGHERPVTTAVVVVPGPIPRQVTGEPDLLPGRQEPAPSWVRLVTDEAPPAGPPGRWPAWVAAGNIGALLLGGRRHWLRRRPSQQGLAATPAG